MKLRNVVISLLATASVLAFAITADDFKRERGGKGDEVKNSFEGRALPAMEFDGWLNIDKTPKSWDDLKGKVVLIDFWAHWCGPCRAAVPKMNELYKKFADKGLVIVAVHSDKDAEKGKAAVSETKMEFPVAFDIQGKLMKTLGCDSYPDYVLIDRKGVIRVVDLANGDVPRAVEALINEK